MLRNYLLTAWRHLLRYRSFSLLNIFGLSIGISAVLLIGLWVADEWQHDRFHERSDRLFLVRSHIEWSDDITATSPGPLAAEMEHLIPEAEFVTRTTNESVWLLKVGNYSQRSPGIAADASFFNVFTFPLLEGTPDQVFQNPSAIVLTQSLSQQLFGDRVPIGEQVDIQFDETVIPLQVSGVISDPPANSDIQFEYIIPWETWEKEHDWVTSWGNVSIYSYVLLRPNSDPLQVDQKLAQISEDHELNSSFFLQSFADSYLYSEFEGTQAVGGRIEYLRLFSAVALFLLIIACMNFTNLATARAHQRSQEIGVRKVIGARTSELWKQFLSESTLLSFLAMAVGLGIVFVSLDRFNDMLQREIPVPWSNPYFWLSCLVVVLSTGLLAGAYPAFFLARFRPLQVLKSKLPILGDRSQVMRNGLVIFQFSISIFLLFAALVIFRQIEYVQSKHLGIERHDRIVVEMEGDLYEQQATFRQEVLASPTIRSFATTSWSPLNITSSSGDLNWPGRTEDMNISVAPLIVGDDFFNTMGIEIIAGRAFSPELDSDSANYIVNEAAIQLMNLEEPIGQRISFWAGEGPIVGVVKNFHLESMRQPIRPLVIIYSPDDTYVAWVQPAPGQTEAAIAHLRASVNRVAPTYPFSYSFADEEFAELYQGETLTASLANLFMITAIVVSCVGLFGLVAFAAARRRKEISIRKVLGATNSQVIQLLSRDFLRLVVISLLIALPLSWWAMQRWLAQYAYRIDIQWWYFLVAGATAIGLTLIVVSSQAWRAATENPVDVIGKGD